MEVSVTFSGYRCYDPAERSRRLAAHADEIRSQKVARDLYHPKMSVSVAHMWSASEHSCLWSSEHKALRLVLVRMWVWQDGMME